MGCLPRRFAVREETRAAVLLALAAPILTELFSANLGPRQLLNPAGFFLAGFIAYGAPVLLLRELAVRWRVGPPGLFLMGVAYGIFNEGLLAKTLFYDNPGSMAHYPDFAPGRVQVVWAAMICTWHALHAVVFPIALVALAFPWVRQPWLRVPVRIGLLALVVGIGRPAFAHARPEYATRAHLLGSLLVIALLLAVASRWRSAVPFLEPWQPGRGRQVALGAVFHPIYFFGYALLEAIHVSPWAVLAWPLAVVGAAYAVVHRARWVSAVPVGYVALGNYTIGAFLNILVNLRGGASDKVGALLVLFVLLLALTAVALCRVTRTTAPDGLRQ